MNHLGLLYLFNTYANQACCLLTEEELLDLLRYLESEPTPNFFSYTIAPESQSRPSEELKEIQAETEPIDFSELVIKTDVEMQRLGWTVEWGRYYLIEMYGKRSRILLTEEELLDFLRYLESQPDSAGG